MLDFLHKPIPFNTSVRNQLVIALILGGVLALIMIFLGPFDTDRFESNYKFSILGGFGVVFSIFYLLTGRLENLWYRSKQEQWTVAYEGLAFLTLVLLASIPIHFYNQVLLNDLFYQDYGTGAYISHGFWFFRTSLLPIMVILLPFYLYFRNRFGTLVTPGASAKVAFYGLNKGEKVVLPQDAVLFVKSSENYVEIFYAKDQETKHKTFRNTLTAIHEQVPFLQQCHRSYLVNTANIKAIKGNSQNAKITFHQNGLDIPLSNTYYKPIKSALRV
ncbi:MAG: LytTR family DNA-binding domain-containing protein [Bacteroidota bacterium]